MNTKTTTNELSSEVEAELVKYGINERFSHLSWEEIAEKIRDAYLLARDIPFASACYRDNHLDELTEVLDDAASIGESVALIDMKQWGIDFYDWKEAVYAARLAMIGDEILDFLDDAAAKWHQLED